MVFSYVPYQPFVTVHFLKNGSVSKRLKHLPALGSVSFRVSWELFYSPDSSPSSKAHISDVMKVFSNGEMTDYLINFAFQLNPNGDSLLPWPKYDTKMPKLLTFQDGDCPWNITDDTYRKEAMDFLATMMLKNPI